MYQDLESVLSEEDVSFSPEKLGIDLDEMERQFVLDEELDEEEYRSLRDNAAGLLMKCLSKTFENSENAVDALEVIGSYDFSRWVSQIIVHLILSGPPGMIATLGEAEKVDLLYDFLREEGFEVIRTGAASIRIEEESSEKVEEAIDRFHDQFEKPPTIQMQEQKDDK